MQRIISFLSLSWIVLVFRRAKDKRWLSRWLMGPQQHRMIWLPWVSVSCCLMAQLSSRCGTSRLFLLYMLNSSLAWIGCKLRILRLILWIRHVPCQVGNVSLDNLRICRHLSSCAPLRHYCTQSVLTSPLLGLGFCAKSEPLHSLAEERARSSSNSNGTLSRFAIGIVMCLLNLACHQKGPLTIVSNW